MPEKTNNTEKSENSIRIQIDPRIYSLDAIYAASYVMLEKAYILLDGNPKNQIIVMITPKNSKNAKEIKNEFMNELIRLGFYKNQAREAGIVKTLILKKILMISDEEMSIYSDKATKKIADKAQALFEKTKER
jgi:His-Xaa-Ser system protein HxsD